MDKIEVYKDKAGEWRWRLRVANGNIVAESGEGYKNFTDVMNQVGKMAQRFNEAEFAIEGMVDAAVEYAEGAGHD